MEGGIEIEEVLYSHPDVLEAAVIGLPDPEWGEKVKAALKPTDLASTQVFTIGHSNRSMADFLALLQEFEIGALVDIRRFPSSRKFPHFNRGSLQDELARNQIGYSWLEPLGGRRQGASWDSSPNKGLKSTGFRNYADHMLTQEFRSGIEDLLRNAGFQRTTVMCAERFFWKCHRRLLGDYLHSQGIAVHHILEPGKLQKHRLTPEARIEGGNVLYPLL
ncbi:MAG: DUF488 family protein [Candidatus Binatia bacterium]